MLFVGESAVRSLINEATAFTAAERAFRALADGSAGLFPTLAGTGTSAGTRVNVKFAVNTAPPLVGLKIGTFWPGNEARGAPNHDATTVLLDPDTGQARAIIAAGYLNRFRTAAADALAVSLLARADATTLAIVGAGAQAPFEVRAIRRVRPITRVLIGVRSPGKASALMRDLADLGVDIQTTTIMDAVKGADIVVTTTNAREALVRSADVRPGTHCSAMGADGIGKQEIDIDLVGRARVFADAPEQAVVIGELQHAFTRGIVTTETITPIGDVLTGCRPGRTRSEEITLFDSSGLAIQDLFAAQAVLDLAIESGLAQELLP